MNDSVAKALASIMDDVILVSGVLSDEPNWLTDAVAYAVKTGDWLYVKHQTEKHLYPDLLALAVDKAECDNALSGLQTLPEAT